jgi:Na+-transporting NADH:ubiquinone oxidoreductase subunit NqrE
VLSNDRSWTALSNKALSKVNDTFFLDFIFFVNLIKALLQKSAVKWQHFRQHFLQ